MFLSLAGVDVTDYLVPGSVQVEMRIGGRMVASFEIIAGRNDLAIAAGQVVRIEHNYLLFAGITDEVEERELTDADDRLHVTVDCVDWSEILDRRMGVKDYESQTVTQIIDDLLSSYLAAEGIWYQFPTTSDNQYYAYADSLQAISETAESSIDSTVGATTIGRLTLVHEPISKALDQIAEATSSWWWISPYKRLHVMPRTAISAPVSITDASAITNVRVRRTRSYYRNQQRILYEGIMDTLTDTAVGDGTRRAFSVSQRMGKLIDVTVNSNAHRFTAKGDMSESTHASGAGGGISNHPNGAKVRVTSTSGTDTNQVLVVGTTTSGSPYTVAAETITLPGGSPNEIQSANPFFKILAAKKIGSSDGTVRVETLASTQIVNLGVGAETSVGIVTASGASGLYVTPRAVADGTTTEIVGIKYDTSSYQAVALSGTTPVTFGAVATSVQEFYVGAVVASRMVTLSAPYEWSWSKDNEVITQSTYAAVLTASDSVTFTYAGIFPALALITDSAEVSARQADEGGTGHYEHVVKLSEHMEPADADARAQDMLDRYTPFPTILSFRWHTYGLQPAQLITVTLAKHDIAAASYLVTKVTWHDLDMPDRDEAFYWEVETVSGDSAGDWVKFWKDFKKKETAYNETSSIVAT